MTLFTAHNFSGDVDGALLGDLIPGVTFFPAATAAISTVQGGRLTWPPSSAGTPYVYGLALIDTGTGAPLRRMTTTCDAQSSFVIAARANDDGSWTAYHITCSRQSDGELLGGYNILRFQADGSAYPDPDYAGYSGGFAHTILTAPSADTSVAIEVDIQADGTFRTYINSTLIVWAPIDGLTYGVLPPELRTGVWGWSTIELGNQGPNVIHAVRVSDYTDLTYISDVSKRRYDDTSSLLRVSASTNTAAVASFDVAIRLLDGTVIATGSAARAGAVTTIDTSAIDPVHAGQAIVVHLSTNLGADQDDDYFLIMPVTALRRETYLGLNQGFLGYAEAGSDPRDLARGTIVRLISPNKFVDLPWQVPGAYDNLPGADIGMQANGWPTRFSVTYPDSPLGFQFPSRLDPSQYGERLVDWSTEPGLNPEMGGFFPGVDQSRRRIYPHERGPGLHRIVVEPFDTTGNYTVDQLNWSLIVSPSTSTFSGNPWNWTCLKL